MTQTATRERPILFSSEMVRALLDGRKTQTRRVVFRDAADIHNPWLVDGTRWQDGDAALRCPYGQPGDRLWVKETWARLAFEHDWETGYVDDWHAAAPNEPGQVVYDADDHGFNDGGNTVADRGFAWRPSIFMPRRYSRITLELTDVRVQRVQDISEEEARSEGVTDGGCLACGNPEPCGCVNAQPDARDAFACLWDSLNAKRGYAWDMNPWVWALTFRRIESTTPEKP